MAKKINRQLTKEEIDQTILEGIQIAQLAMALPLKPEIKAEFLAALQYLDYTQLQSVRKILQGIGRKAIDSVIKEDFSDPLDKVFAGAKKDAQDLAKKYNIKLDQLIQNLPAEEK